LLLQVRGARVVDFYYVSSVIDPAAAFLLAEGRPPAALALLESIVADEKALLSSPTDFAPVALSYYRAVTDHCGNEIIAVFGAILSVLMAKEAGFLFQGQPRHDEAVMAEAVRTCHADHRKLLKLIQTGDAAQAERFWARHHQWIASSAAEMYPALNRLPFTAFE
jgi:DNA-binding FadR family transcriptional regulator